MIDVSTDFSAVRKLAVALVSLVVALERRDIWIFLMWCLAAWYIAEAQRTHQTLKDYDRLRKSMRKAVK